MERKINEKGDIFLPTEDGHGVDISSQRQDELDILSCQVIRERVTAVDKIYAVDLGGGFGVHSVRMAEAGAFVTMIDLSNAATVNFKKVVKQGIIEPDNINFVQKDFRDIVDSDLPEKIDVLYSQRAIHYLPYKEAISVLSRLSNCMVSNGYVFISAAGFDTEYSKTYPDRDKPVEDRFAFVADDMQKKHGIMQRLVTYKEEDMARLLKASGFRYIKVTSSDFGNIKAMARK
ncbi:MAG: class I SAM-dependent methyltransferase [Alphaproteobacteria bacterium]|nr:class I SAM-dependent methyltransferase [Alphaproteobacteria bacterium]